MAPTTTPPTFGAKVYEIPPAALNAFFEACGLNPEHVDNLHLHRGGWGTAQLTVPFEDLAEPLIDAAGLDSDSSHVTSEMAEAVLGCGYNARGDMDGTFYTNEVALRVRQPPRKRGRQR